MNLQMILLRVQLKNPQWKNDNGDALFRLPNGYTVLIGETTMDDSPLYITWSRIPSVALPGLRTLDLDKVAKWFTRAASLPKISSRHTYEGWYHGDQTQCNGKWIRYSRVDFDEWRKLYVHCPVIEPTETLAPD